MADWVVLPLKSLDRAKSRLAPALPPGDRRRLMRAMVLDVLAACRAARRAERVAIVTADPDWQALARAQGCDVIDELIEIGYPAAADLACRSLERRGDVRHVAVLPGDLPLLDAGELDQVMAALAEGARYVIVPSRDGQGTNCVAQRLPLEVPLRHGPQSFDRHLRLAAAAGIAPTVLRLSGLGHDVDLPEDIAALPQARLGPETARALGGLAPLLPIPCQTRRPE